MLIAATTRRPRPGHPQLLAELVAEAEVGFQLAAPCGQHLDAAVISVLAQRPSSELLPIRAAASMTSTSLCPRPRRRSPARCGQLPDAL